MGNSFWKTLERIGVVDQVQDQPPPPANPSQAEVTVQVVQARSKVAAPAPIDAAKLADLDASMTKLLVNAMQNDGAPLVEEISDSLETLAEAIPDEASRYKTALKMMVKRGNSAPVILSDFDKCLGVLEENKRTFEGQQKSQLDAKVGSKVRNVESIEAKIVEAKNSIAALQQQITTLQVQRDSEQAGISTEQHKIEQVQGRFTAVYGAIRSNIEQMRAKIAQYSEGL